LGITHIPNPTYATSIATAFQVTIAHHGIEPNNPYMAPISINLFPEQLIVTITNILPTINALTFVDHVGEFFRVLELEFQLKVLNKLCSLPPSFDKRMKPSRCFTTSFSSLKRIFKASQPGSYPSLSSFVGRYSDTPCADFAMGFCRIWRFVNFAGCVQHS